MRLSAKPLRNYQSVNSFKEASEWAIRNGEPNDLYFRFIDLDQEGLRYIPTSPTVQVTFVKRDGTSLIKTATSVSASDLSLWKVSLLETEEVVTGNVQISISESGVTRRFTLLQALTVEFLNQGGC